jgi:short subunit dehydrogenase-like uncharacterized protein
VAAAQPLAVLGATGYTGGLVVDRARDLGIPLRLVGRRREALTAVARPGDEIRVADARDDGALRDAFAGAFAVASTAGPFGDVGHAPLAAAIACRAHYLDTSPEQEFSRIVYDDFGPRADAAGVVALTAFGFDYVPGDLAARIAADGLEPLGEIVVAYSVARMAASAGTRRSIAAVMASGHVAWEGGRRIPSHFGASTRTVEFPSGAATAVEWSGTEPLTVPRHTRADRVRSYVRAPQLAARTAGIAKLAAPLVRLSGSVGRGPSEDRRGRTRFVVVAEARGAAGRRRVTLAGRDVYGLTALLVARGAAALRSGEVRGAGALAPAEAFDARALLERLEPLLRLEAIDDL